MHSHEVWGKCAIHHLGLALPESEALFSGALNGFALDLFGSTFPKKKRNWAPTPPPRTLRSALWDGVEGLNQTAPRLIHQHPLVLRGTEVATFAARVLQLLLTNDLSSWTLKFLGRPF